MSRLVGQSLSFVGGDPFVFAVELLIRQTEEDDPFVFPRTWHPTWDGRIALLEWAACLGNIRLAGRNTRASTGSWAVIEQEDHHHPSSVC